MFLNFVTFLFSKQTQVLLNVISYSLTLIRGRGGTLKKGYISFVCDCLKNENEKRNDSSVFPKSTNHK